MILLAASERVRLRLVTSFILIGCLLTIANLLALGDVSGGTPADAAN